MEHEQIERPDAAWFAEWKRAQGERLTELPRVFVYENGEKGVIGHHPDFSGGPEYRVIDADKELELYTLKEALETMGVADLMRGVLTSTLVPAPRTQVEALARTHIEIGLVVYAQPSLDDLGNSRELKLSLETIVAKDAAADLVVIIAKTGARLELTHTFTGGEKASFHARLVLVVCEEDARVSLMEGGKGILGTLSVDHIALVGAHAAVSLTRNAPVIGVAVLRADASLAGESARYSESNEFAVCDGCVLELSSRARKFGIDTRADLHEDIVAEGDAHVIRESEGFPGEGQRE